MPETNSRGPVKDSRQAARNNLRANEFSALSNGGVRGFRANIDPNDWQSAPIDPVDGDSDYDLENAPENPGDYIPDSGNSMAATTAANQGVDDDSYNEYFDDDEPMFGPDSDAGDNENTPWRVRSDDSGGSDGDSGDDSSSGDRSRSGDSKDDSYSRDSKDASNSKSSKDKNSDKSKSFGGSGGDSDNGSSAKKANDNEKSGFYNPSGNKGAREGAAGKAAKAAKLAGAAADAASGKGGKAAGKLSGFKKKGPILGIIALLGGLGFGVASTQLLMPFHVIEQLTEMFDGSYTARHSRTPNILKWVFNLENENNTIVQRFGKNKYRANIKPDSRVAKKLQAQGIEVKKSGGKTVLVHNGTEISADDYVETYRNNSEFRNDFNRGIRSIVGRIAAYIDLTVARFLDSHTLTKNLFAGWINDVYNAEGKTSTFHDIILARNPKTAGSIKGESDYHQQEKHEDVPQHDGSVKDEVVEVEKNETVEAGGVGQGGSLREKAESIANVANIAVSATCAMGAVAATVSAIKIATAFDQARRYFSNIGEATDKVKAGDGDASPIYQAAFDLSKKGEGGISALESEGMKMTISGGSYAPQENDYTKMMNVNETFSSFGSSIKFVVGCAAATAVMSMVSVVLELGSCGTFSIGKAVLGIGASVLAGIAINAIIEKIVSLLTQWDKTDLCVEADGARRGECVALGAANYMGINFQNGGGSPASNDKLSEFYDAHVLALADEAELDRTTRSPFDVTTSHTFLGSIVGKLSIFASVNAGNVLAGIFNMTSSALTTLLPSASAVEKGVYLGNQKGSCPDTLEVIHAVGNIYCEPIFITDQSMVAKSPEDNSLDLVDYNSFEMDGDKVKIEDGAEVIRPDSKLGKYIAYCANRTSPYGTVDANIQAQETALVRDTNVNTALTTITSNIPVLGSLLQAMEAVDQVKSLGWSTGANCVVRSGSDTLDGEYEDQNKGGGIQTTSISLQSWDSEMKAAQLYVSDDRFMQSADSDYKSSVIAFLERQEEENPVDNTYAGWLARQTGILKEDVEVALNEVEYWNYIAQYNPEGKGPIRDEEVLEDDNFVIPGNEIFEDYSEKVGVKGAYIVYADTREQYITA